MRKYLLLLIVAIVVALTACQPSPAPPLNSQTEVNPGWSFPAVQGQPNLLPNLADVVGIAAPSVVAINTEVVTMDSSSRSFTEEGAGSGWIIDKNGIIITNNHVVEGAQNVTVTLGDGRTFKAENIFTDPLTDLATLRINAAGLPAARIGEVAKLRVGDWVVAIGNSLGLGISAKEGIISRLGVTVSISPGQTLYNLIETSAAINPGNSGGPLINMAGEIIGITSAKIATIGVEGMGYAISLGTAASIIEKLMQDGCVIRPWTGLEYIALDAIFFTPGTGVDKGAVVTKVAPGSPAEQAGIKQGDIIISFGDKPINTDEDLRMAEQSSQIGQKVKITLWRGNNKSTVELTPVISPPCKY